MQIPTRIDAHGPQGKPHGADRFGEATPQVVAFFRRLKRIPVGAWGQRASADPHTVLRRSAEPSVPAIELTPDAEADRAARARLREIMDTMPSAVERIRRRIDHEVAVIDGMAPRVMVARMRRAARLGACAIAARPWLTPDEFARLYRPFAELIPVDELGMSAQTESSDEGAPVE